ncbi:uncharacterized protein BDR25DRAFT_358825 [Lindgomyces ingoldianus]|uniref:Uncharacterized protein n=1 Tax=Lindgomyces ingoldianus TaxID=673940 RepID=A0ACB6QK62_9PLEO|nr:uncharacterized protein BDR25DRAFT_358825 [Lindgomyces ingoldianus]KAF2467276.1 hypothetical protein BDR25DRAFT_358825 [Lindgomyces ingoldianus]
MPYPSSLMSVRPAGLNLRSCRVLNGLIRTSKQSRVLEQLHSTKSGLHTGPTLERLQVRILVQAGHCRTNTVLMSPVIGDSMALRGRQRGVKHPREDAINYHGVLSAIVGGPARRINIGGCMVEETEPRRLVITSDFDTRLHVQIRNEHGQFNSLSIGWCVALEFFRASAALNKVLSGFKFNKNLPGMARTLVRILHVTAGLSCLVTFFRLHEYNANKLNLMKP